MLVKELRQKLKGQELDADQIAGLLLGDTGLLRTVVDSIYLEKPLVKYACIRALRIVSRTHPQLLYPYFNLWIDLLSSSDVFIQNELVYILANLARVDTQDKIDHFLDDYFEPLSGPSLITAMCVVKGSLRLLRAKPKLKDQIATELLRVQTGRYENEACRPIIYEAVLNALQTMKSRSMWAGMVN